MRSRHGAPAALAPPSSQRRRDGSRPFSGQGFESAHGRLWPGALIRRRSRPPLLIAESETGRADVTMFLRPPGRLSACQRRERSFTADASPQKHLTGYVDLCDLRTGSVAGARRTFRAPQESSHLCGLFLFDAPPFDRLYLPPKASVRNDSQIDLVCSCDPIRLDDRHSDTGAIGVIAVLVAPSFEI